MTLPRSATLRPETARVLFFPMFDWIQKSLQDKAVVCSLNYLEIFDEIQYNAYGELQKLLETPSFSLLTISEDETDDHLKGLSFLAITNNHELVLQFIKCWNDHHYCYFNQN